MKLIRRVAPLVVMVLAVAPAASAQVPAVSGPDPSVLIASVFNPPSPVMATDNRRHLVYEVLLENPSAQPVRVEVVQVFDAHRRTPVGNYAGPTVEAVMFSASESGVVNSRTIAPRAGAVLLLDVAQRPGDPLPNRLEHRFVLLRGPANRPLPAVVTDAPTQVDRTAAVVLSPPLHGDDLGVLGCCGVPFTHRLALLAVDGGLFLAQRFAIDFVRVDARASTFSGDPARNDSYFIYGDKVVAVAAGRIVATRDGVPENSPPNLPPGIQLEGAAGNFVNQDLGGGRFALYAHLQPGSVRVRPGDTVQPGQVLGLVGNTGNSSEPHLHFHVMDGPGGPSNLAAEGVPYVFDRFRLDGRVLGLDRTPPVPFRVPARPSERTRQSPLTGDVLAFP